MTPAEQATATAQIHEMERRRCQAVVERNLTALEELLAEDMIHIHGTGLVENKAAYLNEMAIRWECKASERANLTVRFYGNVAISTGDVLNVVRPLGSADAWRTMNARATIAWLKQGAGWKLISFHASLVTA